MSLPARGVWIEIKAHWYPSGNVKSLPARGVWIEIRSWPQQTSRPSRSPQGECGLKYHVERFVQMFVESLPARGVWIEIYKMCVPGSIPGSLPARGVWIEI